MPTRRSRRGCWPPSICASAYPPCSRRARRPIKAADRAAAYLEATRLAGFSAAEARRFFGTPPKFSAVIERDHLSPWPAEVAERRYLERFVKLARE